MKRMLLLFALVMITVISANAACCDSGLCKRSTQYLWQLGQMGTCSTNDALASCKEFGGCYNCWDLNKDNCKSYIICRRDMCTYNFCYKCVAVGVQYSRNVTCCML